MKFSFEREKLDKLSGFAQQQLSIFLWSIFPTLLKVWNNRKSSEENQTEKFSRKILDTPSPLRLISSLVRKSSVQKFFEEKRQFLACKLASLKILAVSCFLNHQFWRHFFMESIVQIAKERLRTERSEVEWVHAQLSWKFGEKSCK